MSSADNGTRPDIDDPDLLWKNIQRNIEWAVVNCVPKMNETGRQVQTLASKNELEHVQQKRKK